MKIIKIPRLVREMIKLATVSLVIFFFGISFAQAEKGWIFPRFEFVDKSMPAECSAGDMAVDLYLVDLNGNPVSSNGNWRVIVDNGLPKNISEDTNHSGFVCMKPSSFLKVQVNSNGAYDSFESPSVNLSSSDGSDLGTLVGTRFKGFVQLVPHGGNDTVETLGLDNGGVGYYKFGVSKFLIRTNHISGNALNNQISANKVEKTIIRIMGETSAFNKEFGYTGPDSDNGTVYGYNVPNITNEGEGTFFWAATQNLNGKINERGGSYAWTFSNNPFSTISSAGSFFNDTVPPLIDNLKLSTVSDPDGGSVILASTYISDGTSLRNLRFELYDENDNLLKTYCSESYPEQIDSDGNPKGTTGVSKRDFRYGNACEISGVFPGSYKIKVIAEDFFGNIAVKNEVHSIDSDIDIPELGLGNMDKDGNTTESPYEKVSWSSYELYAFVRDLHKSPIPKSPGSNDPTKFLGFCFSLENRDFKQDEPGVTCDWNGGYSNVGLSAPLPFNFARKFNLGSSLNSPVDFTKVKIDGVPILSSTDDFVTIYFRAYGTNAAGTGYSEIVAITDVSTSEAIDPDIVKPLVEFRTGALGPDIIQIGLEKKSLGGVPEIFDWGVCFAETEEEIHAIRDNLETMIIKDNEIDSAMTAASPRVSNASYKFKSPNGNDSYREDGQLAISDYGYLYPTCKMSGPDISSNYTFGRWDTRSDSMRKRAPGEIATHFFLSTSLTTKAEMKINPGSGIKANTKYYGIAFAKNIKGIGIDIKTFTTGTYKYGFGFSNYVYSPSTTNAPKVETIESTYDEDLKLYGNSKLFFHVLDYSTSATPGSGRKVKYDILISKLDGTVVRSLSGFAYAWRTDPREVAGSRYNSPQMTKVDIGSLALGQYQVKITINGDGGYSPGTNAVQWKPVYIINKFEVKSPVGFGDTTTSGGTETTALNIDPNLSLSAEPNLVRAGQSTKIKWEMDNVGPEMKCTIQGPSTFGTDGKETFNHLKDSSKSETDKITGEFDSGAVKNTQIFTFSCANTVQTYTATARVSVVGSQQEI